MPRAKKFKHDVTATFIKIATEDGDAAFVELAQNNSVTLCSMNDNCCNNIWNDF